MSTVTLADLAPNVAPMVPGCSDDLVTLQIKLASRTFARESECIVEKAVLTLSSGIDHLTITPADATNTTVLHILGVSLDGQCVNADRYEFDGSNLIFDERTGKAGQVLKVAYSVLPNANVDALPEKFIKRYNEAICALAISNLCAMPKKPWSDANSATYYRNVYQMELGNAIRDVGTGNTPFDEHLSFLGDCPAESASTVSGTAVGGSNVITVNNIHADANGNINVSGGTEQVQSDWTETDTSKKSYILHKPTLAEVATSGDYDDLSNKPAIPSIVLAACSGLGMATTTSGPAFSWIDPDNVTLNGSTLAEWNATCLIRKEGSSYPASVSDGTKVAETTKAAGTKNYYRDHNFVDTTQETGKTYSYMLFSQTTNGLWNALDANKFSSGTGLSWAQVQMFVKAGRGAELFPVGTVFYVDHPEYTHNDGTGLWFRVAGHDQVPAQDETLTHTMCLEMVDCLFSDQYDASESMYALTEDTVAIAGKVYYTLSGTTYTALVEGTDWNAGDPVPMASWYEKNLDGRQYGSNNSTQNNQIQWLNSAGVTGNWFAKQTIWDVCATGLLNKNGFCKNIDPLFLSVVKPAKLTTAKCTAEGGGSITHYANFWPLSMTQVYGTTNNGITENVQLDYYKNGGDKKKTLKDSSAYTTWWLRSPYTGNAYNVYFVQASGASTYYFALLVYGFSLACIIA